MMVEKWLTEADRSATHLLSDGPAAENGPYVCIEEYVRGKPVVAIYADDYGMSPVVRLSAFEAERLRAVLDELIGPSLDQIALRRAERGQDEDD